MLKGYIWLTVLHFAIHFNVLEASDDREHVHIKVHMPNVLRKHNHYHKVKKYLHHQPRYRPPKKVVQHQPIDADFLYTHENVGPQFFPTPHLPTLPEPELVSDDDYETDIMSAMFEGDATTFPQPYRPAVPPPPQLHTTQVPQLRQQLMQQLFSPEMMSVLAAGGVGGSGVGGSSVGSSSVGGSGSGSGSSSGFGGSSSLGSETNSLMADEILAELQKEYLKKMQKQQIYSEKLTQSKKHKRKKFNKESYQKQQYYEQQQQQQPYSNNFQNNNMFDTRLQPFNYLQQSQPQIQQPQLQDYDDDLDELTEEFDDKSSDEDDFGGDSYQDMYAAYTQSSPMQPQPTQPNRLTWWQYQQQLQLQQEQQQQYQQQQQQTDHFMLPSVRLAPTPFTLPLTSSTAGTTATTSSLLKNGQAYKKRKNRTKSKRNRHAQYFSERGFDD